MAKVVKINTAKVGKINTARVGKTKPKNCFRDFDYARGESLIKNISLNDIDIAMGNKVSSGQYNNVFTALRINKSCKNTKLIFRQTKKRLSRTEALLFSKELEFATLLGKKKIGPRIYWGGTDKGGRGIMVMERLQGDLFDIIIQHKISQQKVEDVVGQKLKELANVGIFCTDLKFENAAANYTTDGKMDIRLIDFDASFCARTGRLNVPTVTKNTSLSMKKVLTVAMMIIFSGNMESRRKSFFEGSKRPLFASVISKERLDILHAAMDIIDYAETCPPYDFGNPIGVINSYMHTQGNMPEIKTAKRVFSVLTGQRLKALTK